MVKTHTLNSKPQADLDRSCLGVRLGRWRKPNVVAGNARKVKWWTATLPAGDSSGHVASIAHGCFPTPPCKGAAPA